MTRNILRLSFGIVSVFLLYYFAASLDLSSVLDLSLQELALLLLLSLANYLFLVLFVKHVFRGHRVILATRDMLFVYASGNVGVLSLSLLPGSIARMVLLEKGFKIPYSKALQIWLTETGLSCFCQAFFAMLGIVLFFDLRTIVLTFGTLLLVLSLLYVLPRIYKANQHASENAEHGRIATTLLSYKDSFLDAVNSIDRAEIACAMVYYLLRSICVVGVCYLLLSHLGYSLNFIVVWSIVALSFWVGIISQIPMGLGAVDVTTVLLLKVIGVSETAALTTVVMTRVCATLIPLVISLVLVNVLLRDYEF